VYDTTFQLVDEMPCQFRWCLTLPKSDIFGQVSNRARLLGYSTEPLQFDSPDGEFRQGDMGLDVQIDPFESMVLVCRKESTNQLFRYPIQLQLTPREWITDDMCIELETRYQLDTGVPYELAHAEALKKKRITML
jgi:hypothetical protein